MDNLINQAKSGHRHALNMLLEQHYSQLYGFLLKLTCDEQWAQDLTQETMIKAVAGIGKFRGDSKFSSWLIRIGINQYKNEARKRQIKTAPLDLQMASGYNVEAEVITKEQIVKINQYLSACKPIDRTIFTLKYYEGYDLKEISELTGVKLGTCKSKIHYLIKKLRSVLEVSV